MTMTWILNLAGLIAVTVLAVWLLRLRASDKLDVIAARRKGQAKLIGRADFVEGMTHFPVVLSVTDKSIFYENMELAAQIDLERIDEVEYADGLSTGKELSKGRVLRLRSHGHTIEFVVDDPMARKLGELLPMHHSDDPGDVHLSS